MTSKLPREEGIREKRIDATSKPSLDVARHCGVVVVVHRRTTSDFEMTIEGIIVAVTSFDKISIHSQETRDVARRTWCLSQFLCEAYA